MQYRNHSRSLLLLLFLSLVASNAQAQASKKEKPNQLDIFKVNVTQIGVNEVRLLYEMELAPAASIEFGAGFIYPNRLWFAQGDTPLLATGAGLYLGYRKYRQAQRYFTAPFMYSYVQPLLFYRYSAYNEEWLLFQGPTPELSECALYSETINQVGAVMRFGGQTTQGRLVADFYAGIGVKYFTRKVTISAFNEMTDVCEVIPATDLNVTTENVNEFQVIFNAGLKIGIRRNNRERNYKERGLSAPDAPEGDNPPIFQP